MKYIGVIAFIAIAACFLSISEGTSSTWGAPGSQDILLHREVVKLDSKFLRVVTRDIVFFSKDPYRTITGIRVTDFNKNSNGGYAYLKSGGPGFRNATIHLKSQRGHGLKFVVEIFGR